MSNKPKIAMMPNQLLMQRICEVVAFPPKPAGFQPTVCCGSDHLGIFLKCRPRNMAYLGSTEWAGRLLP